MCKGVLNFKLRIAVLLLSFLLGSQLSLSAEIFAPFVSGLSASVQANSVTLTWKPAPSGIKTYEIYRSTANFTEATFRNAVKIGSVTSDITTYIDYPPTDDNYYYAVLGRKDESTLYKLFIPYRNITVSPVAVETTDSLKAVAAKIRNLSATAAGDSITLNFESTKPIREVIIYRSSSRIESKQDLINANAIATVSAAKKQYTDYPLGGISYYYAVLDAEMAKAGTYDFNFGVNSLETPVQLPFGAQVSMRSTQIETRITPLPYLLLSNGSFSSANFSRNPFAIDEQTVSIWNSLNKRVSIDSEEETASPAILPIDRTDNVDSLRDSDQQLARIINNSFPDNPQDLSAWQNAEKQLGAFFNISRTEAAETRAHFYMGQIYYFQGKYKQAFFEMIMAQEQLYPHVRPWLERIYPKLLLLDS
jgi:uncharacterized protein YpmB